MKKDQVPQDSCKSYDGHKKLIYAVDDTGHYQGVQSSGWEVEGFATEMAVQQLDEQLNEMKVALIAGKVSPIAYYLPFFRFDLMSLAHATGFFQWQIKRHMKTDVFAKLSVKKLNKYCEAFNVSLEDLKQPVIKE
ncbi:helix-turn-helix domain-containing protein [Colwellia sp. E2M01]|uniref:helix-turn-helix domain-containing protein n=1 Tax=Colwellia sp. E2M01 TaxID=2841561 RepID=UPI001C08593A|nr:helix-turn-helix domain-containing protein [Colwellia sp. E2M01]MBU2871635.1 hypothetical protein [Colwellia sp. E2M01]